MQQIANLIPYLVLVSHVVLVILLVSLITKNSLAYWIGKHAIWLAGLAVLVAVGGSLFYSEIMGFEPCVLCWWQRVFLYPLVIIFGISIWKKINTAFLYAIPLLIMSTLVSAYQSYANLGGASILPCTAAGGACSKVYVMAFGYITIPVMSLTISLFIIMLVWADYVYRRNQTPL